MFLCDFYSWVTILPLVTTLIHFIYSIMIHIKADVNTFHKKAKMDARAGLLAALLMQAWSGLLLPLQDLQRLLHLIVMHRVISLVLCSQVLILQLNIRFDSNPMDISP